MSPPAQHLAPSSPAGSRDGAAADPGRGADGAAPRAPAAAPRALALDALRGVAVLLMLEQHVGIWLWNGQRAHATDAPTALVAINALGGGAAPIFVTLLGVGAALLSERRAAPDRVLLGRGVMLVGFGYLLSAMVPSWFTWRSFYVLHLMGVALVLAPLVRRARALGAVALAAVVLAATAPIQTALATPRTIGNVRMAGWVADEGGRVLPWAPLRLALAEGHFPIFPWLAFALLGFAAGVWLARGQLGRVVALGAGSLGLGAAMAAAWYAGVPFARAAPRVFRLNVPFYPCPPVFVLLLFGAIALVLALWWARPGRLHAESVLVTLGRSSLTLLLLHVPLFRELTIPLGLRSSLSAGPALAVVLGVCVAAALASRAWSRVDYRYGAEWLLRRVAG